MARVRLLCSPSVPEADDGALLADVALGLVLGRLGGGHAVQHGQPHHGLGLQAHPLQEVRHLDGRLPRGLAGGETEGSR